MLFYDYSEQRTTRVDLHSPIHQISDQKPDDISKEYRWTFSINWAYYFLRRTVSVAWTAVKRLPRVFLSILVKLFTWHQRHLLDVSFLDKSWFVFHKKVTQFWIFEPTFPFMGPSKRPSIQNNWICWLGTHAFRKSDCMRMRIITRFVWSLRFGAEVVWATVLCWAPLHTGRIPGLP